MRPSKLIEEERQRRKKNADERRLTGPFLGLQRNSLKRAPKPLPQAAVP
jgi:hypothetical protein